MFFSQYPNMFRYLYFSESQFLKLEQQQKLRLCIFAPEYFLVLQKSTFAKHQRSLIAVDWFDRKLFEKCAEAFMYRSHFYNEKQNSMVTPLYLYKWDMIM